MINKDTWWWDNSVQSALKEKKRAFKEGKALRTEEMHRKYREAKRTAKRAVAVAKAKKYDDVTKEWGRERAKRRCIRSQSQELSPRGL